MLLRLGGGTTEEPASEGSPDSSEPVTVPEDVPSQPVEAVEPTPPTEEASPDTGTQPVDSPWGGSAADSPAPTDVAIPSSGAACDSIGTCGSEDLECANDGVCRPSFSMGTLLPGDGCLDTSDCAYGLSCVSQVCADGEQTAPETPDESPEPNPWGGGQ